MAYLTGRIEARILLPAGLGLWAAFWMLPANDSRGLWAANGEIDILEVGLSLNTVHFVMFTWCKSRNAFISTANSEAFG